MAGNKDTRFFSKFFKRTYDADVVDKSIQDCEDDIVTMKKTITHLNKKLTECELSKVKKPTHKVKRLTKKDAIKIRELHSEESIDENGLAKRYDVTINIIKNILKNKTFRICK